MSESRTAEILSLGAIPAWGRLCKEAEKSAREEQALASFLHTTVLRHDSFTGALSYRLAQKLSDEEMHAMLWREVCEEACEADPGIVEAALADLNATHDRDPACRTYLQPFLYFKGYQAIQSYRIGHWLWQQGREAMSLYLQSRVSELYSIDIHPAAIIGKGIFLDHAHSVVIGETARVGNNVSMLHEVTLGGTGKADEDRHPKIGNGVLIGAGAKVLGNIRAGDGSKIAAGSVVLADVPAGCTVAGVPAKVVGDCCGGTPSETMEQGL